MSEALPLADLLDALPLAALAIDRNDHIAALNAAATTLLGQGATGRHYINVLRQPALVEAVEQCRLDGAPRMASYLSQQGGSDATYEVSLRVIKGSDLLLLSFHDVTSLEQAGQMRRDFVANVSHELRTPLTALMGFIETLRGPARDDAGARERFLGIMAGEAERMNRLVGELLSLSRVEVDERVRPTSNIDLRAVLGATLRNLERLAGDSDVTLKCDCGSEALQLYGDADQLQQVFNNLVENAIKYGGSGKTVDLLVETSLRDAALRGPAVRVTVIDHGPGIEARHLPRLTERFYRADSHRSRAMGGTGLGLAIVKHILNRHRGRLKIASTPGQGARFTVILPLTAPES
ncbi:sensor histidine kinase [Sulfitobacter aestuarii]|uniref:histidine kinase n=1 Tax=Sulfitobacter aestuarii TaxID=2161676 RepID=A0ABW5U390_9RHOB